MGNFDWYSGLVAIVLSIVAGVILMAISWGVKKMLGKKFSKEYKLRVDSANKEMVIQLRQFLVSELPSIDAYYRIESAVCREFKIDKTHLSDFEDVISDLAMEVSKNPFLKIEHKTDLLHKIESWGFDGEDDINEEYTSEDQLDFKGFMELEDLLSALRSFKEIRIGIFFFLMLIGFLTAFSISYFIIQFDVRNGGTLNGFWHYPLKAMYVLIGSGGGIALANYVLLPLYYRIKKL